MSEPLILRLGAGGGSRVAWRTGGDCPRAGMAACLAELDRDMIAAAERVVVLVPGTAVLIRSLEIPARTEAQARAAVSFLLEDEIAAPATTQHFALAPRREGSEDCRVAIVSRACMQDWMRALAEAGIEADVVIPDHGVLDAAPGEAVLCDLSGRVAMAFGDGMSCAVEDSLVPRLLGPLLERAGVERVRVHSPAPERLAPREGWGARTVLTTAGEADGLLWRGACAGTEPNLLQGPFGPPRDWRARWRQWRRVAALAATVALLFVISTLLDIRRHDVMRAAALETAEEIFLRAVPDVGRVVNPRAQIDAALAVAEARSGGDFLLLADVLFESMAGVEGSALSSLRYDAADDVLLAEVVHAGQDELERLARLAGANGVALVKGSSRTTPAGVASEIRLGVRR